MPICIVFQNSFILRDLSYKTEEKKYFFKLYFEPLLHVERSALMKATNIYTYAHIPTTPL